MNKFHLYYLVGSLIVSFIDEIYLALISNISLVNCLLFSIYNSENEWRLEVLKYLPAIIHPHCRKVPSEPAWRPSVRESVVSIVTHIDVSFLGVTCYRFLITYISS